MTKVKRKDHLDSDSSSSYLLSSRFLLQISCFSSNTSSTIRSAYLSDMYHPIELVSCEHIPRMPNACWRTLTKASTLGALQSYPSYPTVGGKGDRSAGQKSFRVGQNRTNLLSTRLQFPLVP